MLLPDTGVPMHALPPCAGEFAFWLGPSVDVLPYYGPVAARAVMHDHELWLHPSSLEGRGLPRPSLQDRVRRRAGWTPRLPVPCRVGWLGAWLGPAGQRHRSAASPSLALAHSPARLPTNSWLLQVPKPDVVMTSYEAFTADAAELKAITWEAVSKPRRDAVTQAPGVPHGTCLRSGHAPLHGPLAWPHETAEPPPSTCPPSCTGGA